MPKCVYDQRWGVIHEAVWRPPKRNKRWLASTQTEVSWWESRCRTQRRDPQESPRSFDATCMLRKESVASWLDPTHAQSV